MLCFEVYINGERRCRAGVGAAGVLSTIVSWVGKEPQSPRKRGRTVRGEADIHVGGLYSPEPGVNVYPRWLQEPLKLGDEISVRIVNADTCDQPYDVHSSSKEESEKREREYYEQLKRRFGDHQPVEPRREPETAAPTRRRKAKTRSRKSRRPSTSR